MITINLNTLLNLLLLLTMGGMAVWMAVLEHKKRRMLRRLGEQWKVFPVPLRAHLRSETFFAEPLKQHQERYPKDVQVLVSFIDAGESCSSLCFHHSGLSDVASWSEGNGLDIARTLVKGIGEMDIYRPGLIPVLQVLLDEQREKAATTNGDTGIRR